MWQPNRAQWRVIWLTALVLILAWPPDEDRSLGVKAVRWLADPAHTLPSLPAPLPMGLGDDGDAVAAHDAQEAEYYRLVESSRLIRTRIRLKEAEDPLTPSTARQLLTGAAVLAVLGVWRLGKPEGLNR